MVKSTRSTDGGQILRGSLYTLRRKCGKPSCRCMSGDQHATPVLSYSLGGSTRLLTLRPQDVPGVKAALKRYQEALGTLNRKALAGIRALRRRIAGEKALAQRARR